MPLSMYDVSVPVLVRGLKNLSHLLDKGLASAEARKIDPSVLVNARLAPDMHPLSRQVQIASDTAKGAVARLSETEAPSWPDTETTFPELKARLKTTIDYLEGFKAAQIDGAEDRTIKMNMGGGEMSFSGRDFLFGFALPNFYFHVATAHDILRHNGVDIGKRDYLGGA
jgi:hypothetical protein